MLTYLFRDVCNRKAGNSTIHKLPIFSIVIFFCLCFYAWVSIQCGANGLAGIRYFISVILYLVFPGWLLASLSDTKICELKPLLSLLYGSVLLIVTYILGMVTHLLWLLKVLPLVMIILLTLIKYRGKCHNVKNCISQGIYCSYQTFSENTPLILLWAFFCAFTAVSFCSMNAHPSVAGAIKSNQDLLWNVGNAEALCKSFPPNEIRFYGVRLAYHYLTELLAAIFCLISGASCYDILTFFQIPLFLGAEIVALYCLGLIFFEGRRKLAVALPFLLFCFQCASLWKVFRSGSSIFGNTFLQHITTNINSQATSIICFCIYLSLLIIISRPQFSFTYLYWFSFFLSFSLFTLGKGPQAALGLCSQAVATIFLVANRRSRRGVAIISIGGTTVIFAIFYAFLYAKGASTSMQFTPLAIEQTLTYKAFEPTADWLCRVVPISGYVWLVLIGIANVFFFSPFSFCLWILGIPNAIKRIWRLDPAHAFLYAGTVGGFLAFHLFSHESSSQIYFAFYGLICMTILAAESLPRLKKVNLFSVGTVLSGAVGIATTICMIIAQSATGIQQIKNISSGVYPQSQAYVTATDEAASIWLRENAPNNTVFVTNRTSQLPTPDNEDGISNVYSAFSGVQCYMEGWTYAMSNMGVSRPVVEHRRAVIREIFSAETSAEKALQICRDEGITCIVYSKQWPGCLNKELIPDYNNGLVAIYFIDNGSQ